MKILSYKSVWQVYATCLIFLFSCKILWAQQQAGIRAVQVRCDTVVTVWLGYESTDNKYALEDKSKYTFSSEDDPEFSAGIQPIAISRFSKASYAPNADWTIDKLDHLIHCILPYQLKKGKNYRVEIGTGLIPSQFDKSISFSYDYTPNPSFKINQVGYSLHASRKYAYLSSFLGDGVPVNLSQYNHFEIRREQDDEPVYSGQIEFISEKDTEGEDALYKLDLSGLVEEGSFYIWVEGLGRSYSFIHGDAAIDSIYHTISRGLYFQRSGTSIEEPWSGPWKRPMAHDSVYVTAKNVIHPWVGDTSEIIYDPNDPSSGDWYVPGGPKVIHGGHYDAGDYDTRLSHVAVAEALMSLYESLPGNFYDGQVFIPEAGNGIPDILDEASWSLLHWEYCQDYASDIRGLDGGMAAGIESYKHPIDVNATGDQDPLPYFLRKVTPYSSYAGAALFAQAARVFREFDIDKSDDYLQRALRAFNWANDNYHMNWDPELPIASDHHEENYTRDMLRGAKLWALGQLFSTTGDDNYLSEFESIYKTGYYNNIYSDIFGNFQYWRPLWGVASADLSAEYQELQGKIVQEYIDAADRTVNWMDEKSWHGYRAACPDSGTWGRASPLHNHNSQVLFRAFMLSKDFRYYDAIANNLDFVLGMNPAEMSYMTGAGAVYPMDPLNTNCKFDGIDEPYPGIVVFGPSSEKLEKNILYPEADDLGFYRRMTDIWTNVQGNEYVVDQQQTSLYMAAGILLTPEKALHIQQNRLGKPKVIAYPNPFKKSVRIRSECSSDEQAMLEVFNITGQKVYQSKATSSPNGYQEFLWDGKGAAGMECPSGIYLGRISSKTTLGLIQILKN